ncbi:hypothetical protein BJV82DRAFT_498141, partial [Fennellomyces sp. T-0311]
LWIPLTVISSALRNSDGNETSFDHYKVMFGMLSMVKTFEQTYNKGFFAIFRKLKAHFVHRHGRQQHSYLFDASTD